MKKIFVCAAVFAVTCLFTAVLAIADETEGWVENGIGFRIEFFDYDDVVYHMNGDSWLVPEGSKINLLMINGGFVGNPQIVIENDRTLVPVRIV